MLLSLTAMNVTTDHPNGLLNPHQSVYRTSSITPLKQPYCISMITSSMPSDNSWCHVFAFLICLLIPLTLTSKLPAFHLGLEFTALS